MEETIEQLIIVKRENQWLISDRKLLEEFWIDKVKSESGR